MLIPRSSEHVKDYTQAQLGSKVFASTTERPVVSVYEQYHTV